jgi:carboxypeptidase C (cathepsin A)
MFHFLIIFNILLIGTSFRRLPNYHNDNKNLNYTEYDIKDEREPKYNIRIQRKITTAEQSEVINLPGLSKDIPLKHYAGHLYVDEHKKDALFYWLFEKPVEPEHAPLLVWLNGGPGKAL